MKARYLFPILGVVVIAMIYVALGLASLRSEIRQNRDALQEQISQTRQSLEGQFAQLGNDTKARFDQHTKQVSDIRQEMICRFTRVETQISQRSAQVEDLLIRLHSQSGQE